MIKEETEVRKKNLGKLFLSLKNIASAGFLLTMFLPILASAFVFEGNLFEGEQSLDIKNLQILLNLENKTKISETGAGSPGQETNFFGSKTKNALIRFQKENGLLSEWGFVGPKTRLILNKKIAEQTISSLPTAKNKEKKLNLVEKTQKFTLRLPSGVKSRSTNLPAKADSKSFSPELTTKSRVASTNKPKISSISPTFGAYGTVITIKGENFSTSSSNTIYTGYSILKNISSYDGKTMTFVVDAFSDIYQQSRNLSNYFKSFSTPLFIYVENNQGKSNGLYFNYLF